ncbi:MAG: GtrA family protein [Amylibacter sp.]|nr:GtrA family protein [Amylibacter sp.]
MGILRHNQILKFAVVGVTVALCYVLLYLGFMAIGFSQPVANGFAFIIAVIVQYFGQTLWTFRRPLNVPDQIMRFTCVISLGLVVSAAITGLIGPAFGWADWLSPIVVTIILPIQNYLLFKIWVFCKSGVSKEKI